MKKFMKVLTSFMLILNPVAGFFIFACIFASHWYLIPLLVIGIILNLKLYFWAHKEEHEAFIKWHNEYSKTHIYLGECYGIDYWRDIKTGEIIEM
jgi:hypothetical protein